MNLSARVAALLCASLLLFPTECKPALADASPAPPFKNAGPPPTEKEAQQFADRMTRGLIISWLRVAPFVTTLAML